jgi:hypothetical protein
MNPTFQDAQAPRAPHRTSANFRAAGAALLLTALALVPRAASSQDLPDADALIRAHNEKTGNASMWGGSGSVTRGIFALTAMGLEGEFVLVTRPPNRQRMDITLPGIGELQQGFDGEVGWSVNPIAGPQLMSGGELEQIREQSSLQASLRDPSVVPGRETISEARYGGEACWKVRLTWASGRTSYDCYSVETGLLVASEMTQESAMGAVDAVTIYRDYTMFDGRLMPARMIQSAAGQDTELRILEVSFEEVPESRVAPPQVIRTLRGGEIEG